jgi:hypothetical protein
MLLLKLIDLTFKDLIVEIDQNGIQK